METVSEVIFIWMKLYKERTVGVIPEVMPMEPNTKPIPSPSVSPMPEESPFVFPFPKTNPTPKGNHLFLLI